MLVWVFVDGVGLAGGVAGRWLERSLPFVRRSLGPGFTAVPDGRTGPLARLWVTQTDLGVAGLPQTATAQTTLLTGVNAAARMGRHVPAFPGPRLRQLLDQGNLVAEAVGRGLKVHLLNGYRRPPLRDTAFTYAVRRTGQGLRLADASDSPSVPSDLGVIHGGIHAPEGVRAVARRMAEACGRLQGDLQIFEYSLPDLVGHGRLAVPPPVVLAALDGFLEGVWQQMGSEDRLIWTGDHGNLEQTGPGHSLAPVPTILWPAGAAPPGAPEGRFTLLDAARLLRTLVLGEPFPAHPSGVP